MNNYTGIPTFINNGLQYLFQSSIIISKTIYKATDYTGKKEFQNLLNYFRRNDTTHINLIRYHSNSYAHLLEKENTTKQLLHDNNDDYNLSLFLYKHTPLFIKHHIDDIYLHKYRITTPVDILITRKEITEYINHIYIYSLYKTMKDLTCTG